jgi:hypothetical protein
VNVRRLSKTLFISFLLPLSFALLMDVILGTTPLVTVLGLLVVFPVGGFFVIRAALSEMDKVIQEVAPAEPAPDESA